MRIILRAVAFAIPNLCAIWIEAFAQTPRGPGGAVYLNAAACVWRSGRSHELCVNAEKNAAAEFEEKAPRFAARAACEAALHGPCAIGFGRRGSGADQNTGFNLPRAAPPLASTIGTSARSRENRECAGPGRRGQSPPG